MKRTIAVSLGAVAIAALAAGCGSAATTTSTSSPPASSGSSATGSGGGAATVQAKSSGLGQILVDGSGRTLYLFKADTGTTSHCNGACAAAWPPDTTNGKPMAGGVSSTLLGTTTRSDHTTQVTYQGHPLYYFAHDANPGEANGQGINAFGGLWFVLAPNGTAITGTAATPSGSTPAGGSGGGY
jgi:predicted lipoprotein with Yx(FWY)xxD motif